MPITEIPERIADVVAVTGTVATRENSFTNVLATHVATVATAATPVVAAPLANRRAISILYADPWTEAHRTDLV